MATSSRHNDRTGPHYRVLMIAPTSFFADYGCHVRILEEARVLQQLGHEVTIATYHNGSDLDDVHIVRTLPIPWRRDFEVGSSRHKIGFDLLLGVKTLELVARNRYDVIHAHLHEGALLGAVLGKLTRTPLVFDFQGSLTEEMIDHGFLRREGRMYKPLRRLEQWIDHAPAAVLTSSANAAQQLVESFNCAPARIHTLPDCVNVDVFTPPAAYEPTYLTDVRAQVGIPADARVIAYLGLLSPYQGTDDLLAATKRIIAAEDDVYLLLMGFPGVDFYRDMAVGLGIDHRVRFTGRVPYGLAPLHLALGNVMVAPKLSLTEGAGKLLNYMALGLPTVAYDTPVAREYLGKDGLLARRGDVESLADMLLEALRPDAVNRARGDRLRARAVRYFDWRQAGQDIVSVYRSVISGAKSIDIMTGAPTGDELG